MNNTEYRILHATYKSCKAFTVTVFCSGIKLCHYGNVWFLVHFTVPKQLWLFRITRNELVSWIICASLHRPVRFYLFYFVDSPWGRICTPVFVILRRAMCTFFVVSPAIFNGLILVYTSCLNTWIRTSQYSGMSLTRLWRSFSSPTLGRLCVLLLEKRGTYRVLKLESNEANEMGEMN